VPAPLPFNTLVVVVRRTTQPTAAERWCYITAPDHGAAGFCEERYLAIDPPEPRARLHRVEGEATLGKIARDAYSEHITTGNDERLYVQGLYEANKDRAGVKLSPVELSWSETWHRKQAEEKTLEVYRGVQVLEGLSLWIPSYDFIHRLKASGAITSGSSELSKAWHAAAELADGTVEALKYAGGFIVGLLEGAWSAIVDLFQGAAEMLEAVARTLYHLVTANPGRIKDMLMTWVDKMQSAWEHRGQITDEFLKRWNAPSGWDRGRFHGEVLGWVMMTILIIVVTAGAGAAANAGSLAARFPQIVKLLKTVDAVGDVTAYLGGAIQGIKATRKLPEAASDLVKGKLSQANHSAAATRDTVASNSARARGNVNETSGLPPMLASKGSKLIHTSREQALSELLEEAKKANVEIHSDEEAQRLLDWAAQADGVDAASYHAVTIGDDIFVRVEHAANVRVLREELIHVFQQRGGIASNQIVEAEIQARLAMIRFRHKWGLTHEEIREIISEVRRIRISGKY
jgi:Domain of unknown function (DUF4157)